MANAKDIRAIEMKKQIDYSGYNQAEITYFYREVGAVRCDLQKTDEQGNTLDAEPNIVFQEGQFPFELTENEKVELIKYYYGDESYSMAE